jgi:hypothetical protein
MFSLLTPEIKTLLKEYREKFGEGYPISYVHGAPDRIRVCIETNTPVPRSEYEHLIGMRM